jgi:ribosome-associated translation inhibitor RaiA
MRGLLSVPFAHCASRSRILKRKSGRSRAKRQNRQGFPEKCDADGYNRDKSARLPVKKWIICAARDSCSTTKREVDMLQVVFHGVDRSAAAEADIAKRFEALKRFDNQMQDCKATITKVGNQGQGEFSVKLDLVVGGQRSVIATENDPDAMAAINKVFDTVRRMVKDENDKRHHR